MRTLLPLLLLLFLAACGSDQNRTQQEQPAASEKAGGKVTVAVAANVQFALDELELAFENETGTELEAVLSSSGKLTAQIQQGAPYHLLLSADMKYPRYLYDNGLAATEPRVYASGSLVLWTTNSLLNMDRPLEAILQDKQVKKIALANPKTAPYGVQGIKTLGHYDLLESLRSKLVYGESIAQVNQYVTSGACEVGFTAKSVVLAPNLPEPGQWLEVDPGAYDPIGQGVVITRYGEQSNAAASRRFYDFLFSETGRAILEKYGYRINE